MSIYIRGFISSLRGTPLPQAGTCASQKAHPHNWTVDMFLKTPRTNIHKVSGIRNMYYWKLMSKFKQKEAILINTKITSSFILNRSLCVVSEL